MNKNVIMARPDTIRKALKTEKAKRFRAPLASNIGPNFLERKRKECIMVLESLLE